MWLFYLQICFHSYRFVIGLNTCSCLHCVVPIGGTLGISIGLTDGGGIEHTCGAQMGLISSADWHMASARPLTHWQLQSAFAALDASSRVTIAGTIFMAIFLSLEAHLSVKMLLLKIVQTGFYGNTYLHTKKQHFCSGNHLPIFGF